VVAEVFFDNHLETNNEETVGYIDFLPTDMYKEGGAQKLHY